MYRAYRLVECDLPGGYVRFGMTGPVRIVP